MPTFFVVLISIYLAGNIYIFRRGAQALVAQPFGVKVLLAVLFWCGALEFFSTKHQIAGCFGSYSPRDRDRLVSFHALYGIMPNHIRFIPTFQLSMQIWFLYILISDT